MRLAAAHVRRRFYELHVNESSQLATQTVTTMARLWEIEAEFRGQDPETRMKARQEKSAAIVATLFDVWRRSYLACPANPNSPRRSAMPHPGAALLSDS